ncbi:S8 family serine peptidase [Methylococcus sp. EFPC2]|uniref:S8 family peptidase n=1 Tax=Methylococcus sp. EFPC2 TaxID=2812648 RepID=UPI0019678CB6|nr:S8 family serine peptidase [Methylococcus sp. EFPC2]QSA95635.1 S8 family serine peptidase [Methylococcus sp. EFPC2]
MKRPRRALFPVIAVAANLLGCAELSGQSTEPPKQMSSRQILVTLPETLRNDWTSIGGELGKRHGIEESGEFPLSSIGVDCLVYKVSEQKDLRWVIEQLEADPRVVLAEENQVFEGLQSGESDPFASIGYGPQLIHADSAHEIATGKGVGIAVVDTGAEKDHPDLKGRLKQIGNFVEGGDVSFIHDRHGTAVTGIIGARANDGVGIYGVAPEAEVSVFKACWYPDQTGAKAQCSSWSLAKALDAAINSGARIINLSLAGSPDELLSKLLEAAHARGINVVAASMEKQDEPGFPAELPLAIPVISAGPDGQPAQPAWRSRYPGVVAAPGVEILTTVPEDGYDFVSGSSLAAAHVSGAIALLLELNPVLTPEQIKQLLTRDGNGKPAFPEHAMDIYTLLRTLRDGLPREPATGKSAYADR